MPFGKQHAPQPEIVEITPAVVADLQVAHEPALEVDLYEDGYVSPAIEAARRGEQVVFGTEIVDVTEPVDGEDGEDAPDESEAEDGATAPDDTQE